MRVRKVDSDAIKLYEVKVKFFAPRQIQRRLLAALVTLSRNGVLLPAVLHGAAGGGEKGARGGSLLRDLL